MILIHKLINDRKVTNYNQPFIFGYEHILNINKIPYRHIEYTIDQQFWEIIEKSKLFIARYRGQEIDLALMHAVLPEIERKGTKTLPNFNTVYHCGDKLRLALFFEANNIPSPKTYCIFEKRDSDYWYASSKNFPIVVKLRRGAGSNNVGIARSTDELDRVIKKLFANKIRDGALEVELKGRLYTLSNAVLKLNKYRIIQQLRFYRNILKDIKRTDNTCLLLQEYLPNNKYDTRITTIGNRAFAFRRQNRIDDFRASGSGLIDYDISKIDDRFIQLALNLSIKYNFQTMAYDFIYDKEGEPSLIEMNYTYVDRAVQACPVFWKTDGRVYDNKGRLPQYYQLVDALSDNKLKYD